MLLKKVITSILLALVLITAVLVGSFGLWYYHLPKFHDVTVELGTNALGIQDFLTEYAQPGRAHFITDVSKIDISRVGDTLLTMQHGMKQETVVLRVQDTTAPTVVFCNELIKDTGYVPNADDFVSSITDLSPTSVRFAQEPVIPADLTDTTVTVIVSDNCGNTVSQECTLSLIWMKDKISVALDSGLTKEDLLIDPSLGADLIDESILEQINASGLGIYTVESTNGQRTLTCTVAVVDDQSPDLQLKELSIYEGFTAEPEDFVISATDTAGNVSFRFALAPDYTKLGRQSVIIEATDSSGNATLQETFLTILDDDAPPVINGIANITVAKHSSFNFMTGVSATDAVSGPCVVTCNASQVNLHRTGTYFVTYIATDKAGNQSVVQRKVVVEHDAEDTAALVKQIAASLSNDPEAIRDYVRSYVYYTTNWGGTDPVWHGFTTRSGNCYVHALCLKAIFDEKGIENQLIWVTGPGDYEKSHYWLLVKINGSWKHIDPTPGPSHSVYSLMNDAQRYETLYVKADGVQRDWDRSMWPACP